jgi:hypothetical protein
MSSSRKLGFRHTQFSEAYTHYPTHFASYVASCWPSSRSMEVRSCAAAPPASPYTLAMQLISIMNSGNANR